MFPNPQNFKLQQPPMQQLDDLSIINSDQHHYYQLLQKHSIEKVTKWVNTIRSPPDSNSSNSNPSIPSNVGRISTPNCLDANCSLCHPPFSIHTHTHVADQTFAPSVSHANVYQPPPSSPNFEQLTLAGAFMQSREVQHRPFEQQPVAPPPPPPMKPTRNDFAVQQPAPLPFNQFLQQVPQNYLPIFMLVPTPSPSHTQPSELRIGVARNLMQSSLFQNPPPNLPAAIPSLFSQSLQPPMYPFARLARPHPSMTPPPTMQGAFKPETGSDRLGPDKANNLQKNENHSETSLWDRPMSTGTKDSNPRGSNESTAMNNNDPQSLSSSSDGPPPPKLNTISRIYNNLKQSDSISNLLAALPTPDTPRVSSRSNMQLIAATVRKQMLFQYRLKHPKKSVESPWKQNDPATSSRVEPGPLTILMAGEARLPSTSHSRISLPMQPLGQPESHSSTALFQISKFNRASHSNAGGRLGTDLKRFKSHFNIQGNRFGGRRKKHVISPKNARSVMKQFLLLSAPVGNATQTRSTATRVAAAKQTEQRPLDCAGGGTKKTGGGQAFVGRRSGVAQLLQSFAQRKAST